MQIFYNTYKIEVCGKKKMRLSKVNQLTLPYTMSMAEYVSRSVVSDSVQPHGL